MLGSWAIAFMLGASSGVILPITITALMSSIANRFWRAPQPLSKDEIAEVVRQVLQEQKDK